jgi:hypothetical protein
LTLDVQLAAMDEDGSIHMNPNFLEQVKQEFPNTMSRMLIACDDGTFRSEKVSESLLFSINLTVTRMGMDGMGGRDAGHAGRDGVHSLEYGVHSLE